MTIIVGNNNMILYLPVPLRFPPEISSSVVGELLPPITKLKAKVLKKGL